MIELYSQVVLVTDAFREQGASRGDVGYVIEAYENGEYEIEFSASDGTTTALITAQTDDVCLAEPTRISTALVS